MRMPRPLSALQLEAINRLKRDKKVMWTKTTSSQTHSLTSLVKKGLVSVHNLDYNGNHNKHSYWELK